MRFAGRMVGAVLVAAFIIIHSQLGLCQQANPVQTYPGVGTTAGGNASGTIATTGTFQQVFAAATPDKPRHGCYIQNNGAAAMFVSEGTTAAAATTAGNGQAFTIPANSTLTNSYSCNFNGSGIVLQGQINIDGTTTQAFFAVQW